MNGEVLASVSSSVALRKESVDRNLACGHFVDLGQKSLSARRAWIEIAGAGIVGNTDVVALRKESVDRNGSSLPIFLLGHVALRKESVDRNTSIDNLTQGVFSRSPQGERG